MGLFWSIDNKTKKLCDDVIDDNTTFIIKIAIRTHKRDLSDVISYLQSTNPIVSYQHNKYIMLLYDPSKKTPLLRSNVSGEILSTLAAEVAICCIKNDICDPYTVDSEIMITTYDEGLKEIQMTASSYDHDGYIYGFQKPVTIIQNDI